MKSGPRITGIRIGCWHFALQLFLFLVVMSFGKGGDPVADAILMVVTFPAGPVLFLADRFIPFNFMFPGVSILSAALLNSVVWGLAGDRIHHLLNKRQDRGTQQTHPEATSKTAPSAVSEASDA